MSFLWPIMLILLLLVPLGVWLYLRQQRRRQTALARYGSFGQLQGSSGQSLGKRRHIPPIMFLLGIIVLIIALARPQATVDLPRTEGTIILTFDVSGSMAADDWQPTRMEAAKAAARDFVLRQPASVLIGVVAFSDGGLTIQAPTNEQDAILAAISRISPQRGTSLGQGILAALKTLAPDDQPQQLSTNELPTPTPAPAGSNRSAAIVLLSDGENTSPPDPLEAAQAAADQGVRIYTIGVGSTTGATLNIDGFSVHTQLDEATLQSIAQLTQGAYYNAQTSQDLAPIYDSIDLQLVVKPEAIEVTALLAGLGIFLLLIGAFCSLLWFGRVP